MQITMIKLSDKDYFSACLNQQVRDELFDKHMLIQKVPLRDPDTDGFKLDKHGQSIFYYEVDITYKQFWNSFSDKCRFCGGELNSDNITKVTTYWNQLVCPCHKDCKVKGMAEEAYDCQLIDADCNWCKHFQRTPGSNMPGGFGNGHCGLDGTEVPCSSNSYAGNECFIHRKSDVK
jgi:hypothetical protein